MSKTRMNDAPFRPARRVFLATSLSAGAAFLLPARLRAAGDATQARALAFDGDTLLAAGSTLAASGDGGRSWTGLTPPGRVASLATHRERPGRVVAGLAEGGVAVSEDGGATWRARGGGLPAGEAAAVAIAAGNPEMLYAAVRGDGLWKTEDAGESWALAMDRPWLDAAERDPLTLASVDLESGMGGIWIYAGTEAGLTRVPDCFCRWQDVQPGNALDALATGDAPPPEAPLPPGEPVLSLASAPSAPATLYAALPSGVWASADGGVIWDRRTEGGATAVAVHPAREGRIAAAVDGILRLSRDGGATWAVPAAE